MTFVNTTLTKRTGATTTVFAPTQIDVNWAYWHASGSLSGFGRYIAGSVKRNNSVRRTSVRVGIPQLNTDGNAVLYRPTAQIDLIIPDGTVQNDVNDLVGYLNALTASGLTNFNSIFVDGVGIY